MEIKSCSCFISLARSFLRARCFLPGTLSSKLHHQTGLVRRLTSSILVRPLTQRTPSSLASGSSSFRTRSKRRAPLSSAVLHCLTRVFIHLSPALHHLPLVALFPPHLLISLSSSASLTYGLDHIGSGLPPPSSLLRPWSTVFAPPITEHGAPSSLLRPPGNVFAPPTTGKRLRSNDHRARSTVFAPTITDHRATSSLLRPPGNVFAPPTTEHRLRSSDHRAPSSLFRSPSTEHRLRSSDHRATSLLLRPPSTLFAPPITDHGAPSSLLRSPTTEHRLRSSDHRARSTVFAPPITEHGAPSSLLRSPTTEHRLRSSDYRATSSLLRPPGTVYAPPTTEQRAPSSLLRPTSSFIFRRRLVHQVLFIPTPGSHSHSFIHSPHSFIHSPHSFILSPHSFILSPHSFIFRRRSFPKAASSFSTLLVYLPRGINPLNSGLDYPSSELQHLSAPAPPSSQQVHYLRSTFVYQVTSSLPRYPPSFPRANSSFLRVPPTSILAPLSLPLHLCHEHQHLPFGPRQLGSELFRACLAILRIFASRFLHLQSTLHFLNFLILHPINTIFPSRYTILAGVTFPSGSFFIFANAFSTLVPARSSFPRVSTSSLRHPPFWLWSPTSSLQAPPSSVGDLCPSPLPRTFFPPLGAR